MININKYIAQSGICSRRQADQIIKEGRVKINGRKADILDKVSEKDTVTIDNKIIKIESRKIYLAFNKPLGVISTTDKNSKNNIMSYIKIPERVFPVGRLDVKSDGLILLTNDGELSQRVLKEKVVEKEYLVKVQRVLSDDFLEKLEKGVKLEGRLTLPAKIEKVDAKTFKITIKEGRKRQIRRMCERFGYEVVQLTRIRIGNICLDEIKSGKYIELEPEKIYNLLGLIKQ